MDSVFEIVWICVFVLAFFVLLVKHLKLQARQLKLQAKLSKHLTIYECSRWMALADFSHHHAPLCCNTEYEDFARRNGATFSPFCLCRNDTVAEKLVRSNPVIKKGILSKGGFEMAHLIPFGVDCNTAWKPLFAPIVRASGASPNIDKLVDLLFYGSQGNNRRNNNTGIIHNRFNFLALGRQFHLLDQQTLLVCIPYSIGGKPVTMESILCWEGEEWSGLVLPHTAQLGRDEFHMNNTDAAGADEISSNDPLVQNAISVFNLYLLMIAPFLAQQQYDLGFAGTPKVRLCQALRGFIRSQTHMPCLKAPSSCFSGSHVKVQHFPARSWDVPGETRHRAPDENDCSSPHPFLLMLRSFNGWLNFLHVTRSWPEWHRFVTSCSMAAQHFATSLVLLPSCCDVSTNMPDCVLCKANCLVSRPHAFGELNEKVMNDANLLVYAHAEISKESCKMILMAKPTAVRQKRGAHRSSVDSEAETEPSAEDDE